MARTAAFTQDDLDRARKLRDSHVNERDCRAALIVLLIAEHGLTREEAADIFGIDIKTVFNDMERIRNPQPEKERGGRHNCLMTADEETRFLDKFSEKAKSGHIITMPELHTEYNRLVGRETPKSTFYRLLKRHNWRKVLPDTRHPKADLAAQEEFKKKRSKWNWIKPS